MPLLSPFVSSVLVGSLGVVLFVCGRRLWVAEQTPPVVDYEAILDPPPLKRYTKLQSYHVPLTGYTYPSIRTIYRKHLQSSDPSTKSAALPLLVFVHGLGGCAAQFAPLLESLVNVSSCLAIDLPGCGRSAYAPTDWHAYTTRSLAALIRVVVESHRDVTGDQDVVFIAHSLGCSLTALLASDATVMPDSLPLKTIGFVALCPRADPMTHEQQVKTKRLLMIPELIFNVLRRLDRRGGLASASVSRMAGAQASRRTRELQLVFNLSSRTPVWRRMTAGLLPSSESPPQTGGLPDRYIWQKIDCPVLLMAGENDTVTAPAEVDKLCSYLSTHRQDGPMASDDTVERTPKNERHPQSTASPRQQAVKKMILPAPASHALIYASESSRAVSGAIQAFLANHVDSRLSLGRQLTSSGKWDVKNPEKWQSTPATSTGPIAGLFLAMKTMRAVDDEHCPERFVERWGARVKAVVDISHESPVYDPHGLEFGGVEYRKFPSVSKSPPSDDEVEGFEKLLNQFCGPDERGNLVARDVAGDDKEGKSKDLIAIHCHYGFNRTGYFVICYLVDCLGWKLQDAIDEFARLRPPGVKHDYFLAALRRRYALGRPESLADAV